MPVSPRQPHLSLDESCMVSPQCILDPLQHRPQLGALRIRLDEVNHPPQDRPLIGIDVARRPLLHRDEDVARQEAVCDLSHLAGSERRYRTLLVDLASVWEEHGMSGDGPDGRRLFTGAKHTSRS